MQRHPDLDLLALHALGEPVLGPGALAHVATCHPCRTTVDELARTVRTARGPDVGDARPAPVPARVWQGIADELDLAPDVRPASVGPTVVPAAPTAPALRAAGPERGASTATTGRPVVPPGRRERARPGAALRLVSVAAAGLVVGAAGTALVLQQRGGDDGPDPVVLAAAELEAFGAGEGTAVAGSAQLAGPADVAGTGTTGPSAAVLELSIDDLPDTAGEYLEVWLIDPGSGGMVSLGPLVPGAPGTVTARLTVPAGIDVAAFALVDVSSEPPDGDPTHSGVSLVRGTLGT